MKKQIDFKRVLDPNENIPVALNPTDYIFIRTDYPLRRILNWQLQERIQRQWSLSLSMRK